MLKKLRLERFKNFKDAELILGPLTLLVGTNASGKSNIRDAFRFLHGISRNYSLAEIFGEKWIEGGVLQWHGIRGGTREVTYHGAKSFALEASFLLRKESSETEAIYHIEVDLGTNSQAPSLITERLTIAGQENTLFEAEFISERGQRSFIVKVLSVPVENRPTAFTFNRPIVSQLAELVTDISIEEKTLVPGSSLREVAKAMLQAFSSMRFLDLSPDAMRLPSLPGQTILGDRGENLSSVLQEICEIPERKQALLQWVQELTPIEFMLSSLFNGL